MNGKLFIGELMGTFILVALGCGSVALAILYTWPLWLVVCWWIAAVFLGIASSHPLCGAHLNPGVSLAFLQLKAMTFKQFLTSVVAQLLGAFIAGWAVWLLFGERLIAADGIHAFGEFYPNPGMHIETLTTWQAGLLEGVGTFLLMTGIIHISRSKLNKWIQFALIAVTLGTLIYFIAPYTQAGFNPARDFGPRLVAYFAHWGDAAFEQGWNSMYVYVLSPFLGGWLAAGLYLYSQYRKGKPNAFNQNI